MVQPLGPEHNVSLDFYVSMGFVAFVFIDF